MILIIIAILLITAGIIWFWKGPVAKSATSLQEDGSSKSEAYALILLLSAGLAVAIYMIIRVL